MNGNDLVWYACYGSNLCAERFRYYIEGGLCPLNNRPYKGCSDKTLWRASRVQRFKGKRYFAQSSGTWGGKGVAFYNPDADGCVTMRLYLITREQFKEVQEQEGKSDSWYGRIIDLGTDDAGIPIYTFTSKRRGEPNAPSENYASLIRTALIEECGLSQAEAEAEMSIIANSKEK